MTAIRAAATGLLALLLAPAMPASAQAGCPGTIQWDGGGGTTAWATPANWSTNVLPAAGDDVCIPNLAAGVEVVHSSGTQAVHSLAGAGGLEVSGGTLSFAVGSPGLGQLTLSGGTLAGTGDLPVTGPFAWSGGAMRGAGTTSVSNAAFSNFAVKDLLDGRALSAAGTTVWQGTGQIRLGGGGSILVVPGAVWQVQNNAPLTTLDGTGSLSVPAGATFRKRSGGTSTVAVLVTAGGTLSVENGTLSLAGGSTVTGTVVASPGTKLQIAGGAHAFRPSSSLSAGIVEASAGTLAIEGSYSAPYLVISNTGGIDFNSGETIDLHSLVMTGGRLAGSDLVTVTPGPGDSVSWSGGEMTGTGITRMTAGTLVLTGPASKDLTGGRALETEVVQWVGTGPIRVGSGATIHATRSWTLGGDAPLLDLGGAGAFTNEGYPTVFDKAAGSGTSVVGIPFVNTNSAEVRVSAGTLQFTGGLTQSHYGSIVLDGGDVAATAPLVLQFGALGGHGTVFASVTTSGSISPTGTLRIEGTYTQTSVGLLGISLLAAERDRVDVMGAASLSGALSVGLYGFVPQDGDTFTVLTAPVVSGSFESRAMPPLPLGLAWLVQVDPTAVVLEIVAGLDADGDSIADPDDCAPTDPGSTGFPTEITLGSPSFHSEQRMVWVQQEPFTGQGTVYDIVRGFLDDLPVGGGSETCLVSGTGADYWDDAAAPSPGTGFYYLIRARNACGAGTYGPGAGGSPRATSACPE